MFFFSFSRIKRKKMATREEELQKKREEAERKARRGEIDPTHEFTFQVWTKLNHFDRNLKNKLRYLGSKLVASLVEFPLRFSTSSGVFFTFWILLLKNFKLQTVKNISEFWRKNSKLKNDWLLLATAAEKHQWRHWINVNKWCLIQSWSNHISIRLCLLLFWPMKSHGKCVAAEIKQNILS